MQTSTVDHVGPIHRDEREPPDPSVTPARRAIHALVVSDIRLYRDGLVRFLSSSDLVTVVGSAADWEEVTRLLSTLAPDVMLLDAAFPDALALMAAVRPQYPGLKVIALGVFESDEVIACAEAGVDGYVGREGSLNDLLQVVESVSRGELLCTPRVAATLLRRIAQQAAGASPSGLPLTVREAEIAHLIDQGFTNKDIAVRLGVETATVKNHVHNLLSKLRVHRRSEAAAWLRTRRTPPLSYLRTTRDRGKI